MNPAPIVGASILCYLDPLFVWPVAGALIAGCSGWPFLAGVLFAASVLTKVQAVVVLPAVALALWNGGAARDRWRRFVERRRRRRAGSRGRSRANRRSRRAAEAWSRRCSPLTRHDMLSGNAC